MKTTETRKPQVDHNVRALRNDELDAVSGGGITETMKNFGSALQTAARS